MQTDDEIAKAIEISCAKQFIDELPLGIETVIGEKGMGLSGRADSTPCNRKKLACKLTCSSAG